MIPLHDKMLTKWRAVQLCFLHRNDTTDVYSPLSSSTAFSAASESSKLTKPKPLFLPVSSPMIYESQIMSITLVFSLKKYLKDFLVFDWYPTLGHIVKTRHALRIAISPLICFSGKRVGFPGNRRRATFSNLFLCPRVDISWKLKTWLNCPFKVLTLTYNHSEL